MTSTLRSSALPARSDRLWAAVRALAVLALCWAVLLGIVVLIGETVVHAGNGFVSAHVDRPVERWVQPASSLARRLAGAVTILGSTPISTALLIVLLAVVLQRRRDMAGVAAAMYLGAVLVTTAGKVIVQRAGPAHRLTTGLRDYSFPSGHSTASAALFVGGALVLSASGRSYHRPAWLVVGVVMAALVAASRVVLDVHWTTDVIAGFLVGTTWSVLVMHLWSRSVFNAEAGTSG